MLDSYHRYKHRCNSHPTIHTYHLLLSALANSYSSSSSSSLSTQRPQDNNKNNTNQNNNIGNTTSDKISLFIEIFFEMLANNITPNAETRKITNLFPPQQLKRAILHHRNHNPITTNDNNNNSNISDSDTTPKKDHSLNNAMIQWLEFNRNINNSTNTTTTTTSPLSSSTSSEDETSIVVKLRSFGGRGEFDKMEEYAKEMKLQGFPMIPIYLVLMDIYRSWKKTDLVLQTLDNVVKDNLQVTQDMLLLAIRSFIYEEEYKVPNNYNNNNSNSPSNT